MLIIAQPKSASTSLMHGLSQILGVNCDQEKGLRKKFNPVVELNCLPHSDMVHVPYNKLINWIEQKNIYKQHLPPNK